LVIVIILELISAKMLRKIKKKIENEFFETTNHAEDKIESIKTGKKTDEIKAAKLKKVIAKSDKKEHTKKIAKKEVKQELGKATKISAKKESTKRKVSSKK
jgi:hypothetical protein